MKTSLVKLVVLSLITFAGASTVRAECSVSYSSEVSYPSGISNTHDADARSTLKAALEARGVFFKILPGGTDQSPSETDFSVQAVTHQSSERHFEVALNLKDQSGETIQVLERATTVKLKGAQQRQVRYQVQAGERKPIGWYFEQLSIALTRKSEKKEKTKTDHHAIEEFADVIVEACHSKI